MVGLLVLLPEQLLSCNLYQCSAVGTDVARLAYRGFKALKQIVKLHFQAAGKGADADCLQVSLCKFLRATS